MAFEGLAVSGLDKAILFVRLLPDAVDAELAKSMETRVRPAMYLARAATPVGPAGDPHAGAMRGSVRIKADLKKSHPGVSIVFGGGKARYAGVRMFGKRANVRPHTQLGHPVAFYQRRLTPQPRAWKVLEGHRDSIGNAIVDDVNKLIERLSRG